MDIIQQTLFVKEWPLKKPGDEMFFGYVVALGVFPRTWDARGLLAYVDFAHGESYVRYHLPEDDDLLNRLMMVLWSNLQANSSGLGIAYKVCTRLTENGYEVDHLP